MRLRHPPRRVVGFIVAVCLFSFMTSFFLSPTPARREVRSVNQREHSRTVATLSATQPPAATASVVRHDHHQARRRVRVYNVTINVHLDTLSRLHCHSKILLPLSHVLAAAKGNDDDFRVVLNHPSKTKGTSSSTLSSSSECERLLAALLSHHNHDDEGEGIGTSSLLSLELPPSKTILDEDADRDILLDYRRSGATAYLRSKIIHVLIPLSTPTGGDGGAVFLHGHTSRQTESFLPAFLKNFSNVVLPGATRTIQQVMPDTPISLALPIVANANVVVLVHSVANIPHILYMMTAMSPSGLSQPPPLVVHILPRGAHYRDQLIVERLAMVHGVGYLNHRPEGDSHRNRVAAGLTDAFSMHWKEGYKLCMEVMLWRAMRTELSAATKSSHSPPSAAASPCVVVNKRNRYDPDHVRCAPAAVGDGALHIPTSDAKEDIVFGYRIENHAKFTTVPVKRENSSAIKTYCTQHFPDVVLYVHYPWVRDNIYHQHNDNFLPLFSAFDVHGTHTRESRHLALLPSTRSLKPLPSFEIIAHHLFGEVFAWDTAMQQSTRCYKAVVWGRPQRPFAMSVPDVLPYAAHRVHYRFRSYMYDRLGVTSPTPTIQQHRQRQRQEQSAVVVTWIVRKSKRVLLNEKILFDAISQQRGLINKNNNSTSVDVVLKFCCEGMSFEDQVRHMAATDVLVGTHGAGLLHILYLRPGALAMHVASRRLNYHEQTIIERIAVFSGVRYLNTRTYTPHDDATAAWEVDYRLPEKELRQIAVQALVGHV
eukprot:PhM_4_TR17585/c0_g1_i1/m.94036